MAAAALALVVANSPWAELISTPCMIYLFGLSLSHWINDGLMAIFFEGFKGRVATYIERIQFRREAPWTRSARTARVSI